MAEPPANRLYVDQCEDHAATAARAYHGDRVYYWLLAKRQRPVR